MISQARELLDDKIRVSKISGDYQMTYREELECHYSDTFKDAHGCRPRHDTSHMSDADMEAEISGLNTFGWQEAMSRADDSLSWEAIGRMTVGEMVRRIGELDARPHIPTAGIGWTFERAL
jgi:hypothetical protein